MKIETVLRASILLNIAFVGIIRVQAAEIDARKDHSRKVAIWGKMMQDMVREHLDNGGEMRISKKTREYQDSYVMFHENGLL